MRGIRRAQRRTAATAALTKTGKGCGRAAAESGEPRLRPPVSTLLRRALRAAARLRLARAFAARVSLPMALAAAVLCFVLGRLTLARPPARAPDPGFLAAFADASHQVALKEAALARSSSSSSSEGATPALTDASLVHAAPSDREPLPAGANGNKVIHNIPFQVLSWNPRAVFFPGFLDEARCKRVVELADARLAPSSLALRAGDTAQNTADIRTSQGTFLTRGDDKEGVLDYLEKRIADVTMLPQRHGEPFNVLRYEVGQKYDSHYDTFDPESYGPQSSQRVISFLVYLSEWEEGGETVFPLEGPGGLARLRNIDYRSCDMGLKVKPMRVGDALLFYSMHPNATFDKHALHGGCPVSKGTKWVATKWIRDKSFGAF